jgi:hypothetical protein
MSEDERSYYRSRAEEELWAARSADHPDAARAHYLLAGYYLDLAYNPDAARDHPRRGEAAAAAGPMVGQMFKAEAFC